MRRYRIILLTIILAITFAGCSIKKSDLAEASVEEPFVEASHSRTNEYPAEFDTMSKKSGGLTVQIASDIFEEAESEVIFSQISGDYQCLKEGAECPQKNITIYVVEQTIVGKPQVIGEEVFCSIEDVENGAYRMYLIKACMDMHSMWKCVGLSDVLFLTEDQKSQIDTARLQEYYESDENMNAMSLFPSYFSEKFCSADEIRMAEETACLLSQYIIDNYGMNEYLSNGDDVAYRIDWLKSIGVEENLPWDDDDIENVTEIDFSSSVNAPLILTIDHWNFYMSQTDWLVTAEDAYLFVKDTMDGYQLLKDELEKYGIAQTEMILEAQNADKAIHLKNSTTKASQTKGYTIYLNSPSNVWHEMVHALMPDLLKSKNYWVSEGIAEFLSRPIVEWSKVNGAEWKEIALTYLISTSEEQKEWSEERQRFWNMVVEEYQKTEQIPALAEEVDSLLFYEIFATKKALNHDMETGWSAADYSLGQHVIRSADNLPVETDGNALSYMEAYLMIQYLVEKYDMESIVEFGTEAADFEMIFGVGYEQEYKEWYATLILGADDK